MCNRIVDAVGPHSSETRTARTHSGSLIGARRLQLHLLLLPRSRFPPSAGLSPSAAGPSSPGAALVCPRAFPLPVTSGPSRWCPPGRGGAFAWISDPRAPPHPLPLSPPRGQSVSYPSGAPAPLPNSSLSRVRTPLGPPQRSGQRRRCGPAPWGSCLAAPTGTSSTCRLESGRGSTGGAEGAERGAGPRGPGRSLGPGSCSTPGIGEASLFPCLLPPAAPGKPSLRKEKMEKMFLACPLVDN
ncbi:translation initiation factor IF-2-like [Artibeus jamaicensis]|uniref:translation initiation factor IF-2-like n=1 Tax=Artibeus jamaicensis TaxID=9417 RepID=UPI00235AF3F9|nr:translation initiation factor IF-2-like [Artibeus jamaicensis]